VQKDVQASIEEYGKHSLGPGYRKLLENRLYYIKQRFDSGNISPEERALLETQQEFVIKAIGVSYQEKKTTRSLYDSFKATFWGSTK